MNSIRIILVAGACASLTLPATGQTLADFDKIKIGMTLKDFIAARPEAAPVSEKRFGRPKTVDLGVGDQKLRESNIKQNLGDLMGVLKGTSKSFFFVGNYTFEKGKLTLCQLVWTASAPRMTEARPGYIEGCIKRFGQDFERGIAQGATEESEDMLAPFMLWERKDSVAMLVSAPPKKVRFAKEGQSALAIVLSVPGHPDQRKPTSQPLTDGAKEALFVEHGIPAPKPKADAAKPKGGVKGE